MKLILMIKRVFHPGSTASIKHSKKHLDSLKQFMMGTAKTTPSVWVSFFVED